jgi:hypothetical protein
MSFATRSSTLRKTCPRHPPQTRPPPTPDGGHTHADRACCHSFRWGVDYLKFDDCGEMNLASYAKFSVMRDAIARTGRPMVYSFEPYTGGLQTPWLGTVGNSWRTGPDARPNYASVIGNAFVNNMAASLAGPGKFNDADMLEIGNGQITVAEARTQFSLWCLMKSPLLIGANMQTIAAPFVEIMKNAELIGVNQDIAGIQGTLRAAFAYADGDARGGEPSAAAAAILNAATGRAAAAAAAAIAVGDDDDEASGSLPQVGSPFNCITYCEFAPNITAHQTWTLNSLATGGVTIQQSSTCLVATKGGGPVSVAPCDSSSAAQAWSAESVNTTIAQITPAGDATLCLTVMDVDAGGEDSPNSTALTTVTCVPKPHNCASHGL